MEHAITHSESAVDRRAICFALSPDFAKVANNASVPVTTYNNYLEFSQKLPEATCFVIGTHDAPKACKLLKNLRSEPSMALKPVFLLKSLGQLVERLCDGVVDTIEEALEKAKPIERLLADLDLSQFTDPESAPYRMLAYLYSRPSASLDPIGEWRNERYYSYPIAEAMMAPSDGTQTLLGLLERKLLAPVRLVDRLRHCPKCDGVHLNYIDTCPSCGSIEIEQKPFLHCFACGHVGPEERFLSQTGLTCPQCTARLRHIGADYDRPLENFQCNACQHVFIDPKIVARCMHCNTTSAPEDLMPRSVNALQLTEKGRISARTGSVDDVFTLLDDLNNVDQSYFESIVDWLLSLCRRHKEEQFSLIGIRIQNIIELTDHIGRLRVREVMDEFARRVRELIRSTDLTTRTNQYTLWLLLPKTDYEGNQVVRGRILALQSDTGSGLKLATTTFHAPTQMATGEKARLLMARLEGEIIE